MIEKLNRLLKQKNASLIELQYYEKIFGNILVKIEAKGQCHEFIIDRGEIWHNDEILCDNSYHIKGRDDYFNRLCEIIIKKI